MLKDNFGRRIFEKLLWIKIILNIFFVALKVRNKMNRNSIIWIWIMIVSSVLIWNIFAFENMSSLINILHFFTIITTILNLYLFIFILAWLHTSLLQILLSFHFWVLIFLFSILKLLFLPLHINLFVWYFHIIVFYMLQFLK
jgi:hypothetical protein